MRFLSKPLMMFTLLAMLVLGIVPAITTAQNTVVPYDTPYAMLYDYYGAINRLDFQTAYNLRVSPRQTYDAFAGGFRGTLRVVPYFGSIEGTTPNTGGQLRTVLIGYQTDGTAKSYVGCFAVTKASGDWRIASFKFEPISIVTQPLYHASIDALLNQPCGGPYRVTGIAGDPEANAITMLHNYYDLINQQNYGLAYAMWLAPIPGPKPNGAPATDYRTPYVTWAKGYETTRYIWAYTNGYDEQGASAGHSYLNGFLPVVLISQHTDNTFEAFSGCYVIGGLSNGSLGIVNGKFTRFSTTAPTAAEIEANIPTDCASLAIPM